MILLEKRTHLFLKIPLAVVRLLPLDVQNQRSRLRWTDGKCPIPALPRKRVNTLNLHPLRRSGLQLLHQLCQALRRMQTDGEMHMVGHTPDSKTIAFPIAHNCRKISMQPAPHILLQQWTAILRTEDDMDQHETQRLGHGGQYSSGLQPANCLRVETWGVAPGYGISGLQPEALCQNPACGFLRCASLSLISNL